jgi:hypothetical protein
MQSADTHETHEVAKLVSGVLPAHRQICPEKSSPLISNRVTKSIDHTTPANLNWGVLGAMLNLRQSKGLITRKVMISNYVQVADQTANTKGTREVHNTQYHDCIKTIKFVSRPWIHAIRHRGRNLLTSPLYCKRLEGVETNPGDGCCPSKLTEPSYDEDITYHRAPCTHCGNDAVSSWAVSRKKRNKEQHAKNGNQASRATKKNKTIAKKGLSSLEKFADKVMGRTVQKVESMRSQVPPKKKEAKFYPSSQASKPRSQGPMAAAKAAASDPFHNVMPPLGFDTFSPSSVCSAYATGSFNSNASDGSALIVVNASLSNFIATKSNTASGLGAALYDFVPVANYSVFSGSEPLARPLAMSLRVWVNEALTSVPGMCYYGCIDPGTCIFDGNTQTTLSQNNAIPGGNRVLPYDITQPGVSMPNSANASGVEVRRTYSGGNVSAWTTLDTMDKCPANRDLPLAIWKRKTLADTLYNEGFGAAGANRVWMPAGKVLSTVTTSADAIFEPAYCQQGPSLVYSFSGLPPGTTIYYDAIYQFEVEDATDNTSSLVSSRAIPVRVDQPSKEEAIYQLDSAKPASPKDHSFWGKLGRTVSSTLLGPVGELVYDGLFGADAVYTDGRAHFRKTATRGNIMMNSEQIIQHKVGKVMLAQSEQKSCDPPNSITVPSTPGNGLQNTHLRR